MPIFCRNEFTLKSNSISLVNLRWTSNGFHRIYYAFTFSHKILVSDFPTQNCYFVFLMKTIFFILPYFDCGLRGIFFESDFWTQNFSLSVHHLWVVADGGYFWRAIFSTTIQSKFKQCFVIAYGIYFKRATEKL